MSRNIKNQWKGEKIKVKSKWGREMVTEGQWERKKEKEERIRKKRKWLPVNDLSTLLKKAYMPGIKKDLERRGIL